MPEGPTIFYLKNKLQKLEGSTVQYISGYGDLDKTNLENILLKSIETHGKNLLFVFQDFFLNVHLGLFGSMLLNENKKSNPSFAIHFLNDEVNFYVAKTKKIQGSPMDYYNFRTDPLKKEYDPEFVLLQLISNYAESDIGDVMLDQKIMTGVGNIIRIEVLFRTKIHPQNKVKDIPIKQLKNLIKQTVDYSHEFLKLHSLGVLKNSTMVYGREKCPVDQSELRIKSMGKTKRKTYVCEQCQEIYK